MLELSTSGCSFCCITGTCSAEGGCTGTYASIPGKKAAQAPMPLYRGRRLHRHLCLYTGEEGCTCTYVSISGKKAAQAPIPLYRGRRLHRHLYLYTGEECTGTYVSWGRRLHRHLCFSGKKASQAPMPLYGGGGGGGERLHRHLYLYTGEEGCTGTYASIWGGGGGGGEGCTGTYIPGTSLNPSIFEKGGTPSFNMFFVVVEVAKRSFCLLTQSSWFITQCSLLYLHSNEWLSYSQN